MRLTFKNVGELDMTVHIEPSTDRVILSSGDILEMEPKYEGNYDFETHTEPQQIVIWIPRHQSVIFYKNGEKISSFCENFLW